MPKTFQAAVTKFLVGILVLPILAVVLTANPQPAHAAISTPYVWVANFFIDKVTKVDTATGAVIGSYAVPDPMGVAVDSVGDVWVTSYNTGHTVTKLNGTTGAVIGTYDPGDHYPWAVAIDADDNAWVAVSNSNKVRKFNGATGAVMGTYAVGQQPISIAVDSDNNVWVVNSFDDTVTKLNGATGATIGTYATGSNPFFLAVDGDNNIWVPNYASDTVSKINGDTGATIGEYPVGDQPYGAAVDGNGNVWITNWMDETVSKLDVATGATLGTYAIAPNWSLSVDGSGNIWVEDTYDTNIFKLNGATGATLGTYDIVSYGRTLGDATGFALHYFVLGERDVTIAADGTGTGTFDQVSPVAVTAGDNLDITATPTAGSGFNAWTGCSSTTGNVCHLTNITASTTVTATFDLLPPNSDPKVEFEDLPGKDAPINLDDGQTITDPVYTIKILPEGKYDLAKVDFYINGALVYTDTKPGKDGVYAFDLDATALTGDVSIKAIVYDIKGHATAIARLVKILGASTTATLTTLPQTGADLK